MSTEIPPVVIVHGRHPVVRTLAAFPVALFTGALMTDVAYLQTTNVMWVDFSDWLLALGMVMGVLAAIAGLLVWMTGRNRRGIPREARHAAWPVALGSLAVLVVAFVNNLVHSRDAWTSVMPEGIILSVLTVVLIVVTIWASSVLGRPRTIAYVGVRS